MQEMPFMTPEIQKISGVHAPGPPSTLGPGGPRCPDIILVSPPIDEASGSAPAWPIIVRNCISNY
jgi:hypothetical protein